jgi:hypothetical protein
MKYIIIDVIENKKNNFLKRIRFILVVVFPNMPSSRWEARHYKSEYNLPAISDHDIHYNYQ